VFCDEDRYILAVGTSLLHHGCHIQVPPVLVQRRDRSQSIGERELRRLVIEAATQPLEVQLGLLSVAQAPEEALQPCTASRADLLAKNDDGCKLEEQFICCYMLCQALRSLSIVVPRLWQEEAGLFDRVKLEEVAKEDYNRDPAKRAMRVVSIQPQAAIYRCQCKAAYLADLVDDQHIPILPTKLFFFRYILCSFCVALESNVRRRMEGHSSDECSRVSASACQEQRVQPVFQPEHVLDSVYDARFTRAPFTADVLEVLLALIFLESRAALVKERC
jgi:hypothetical protein